MQDHPQAWWKGTRRVWKIYPGHHIWLWQQKSYICSRNEDMKIVWIHKILIYLSLCARFWEKRYRPLRFALLLLFDEKVFGLISSQSGIDMYNIIPLLTFFDLDILPYAALTISNFIILINLCQNALNYHCSWSDISTRNFHFQYIKNFQKKETFQGWIIFFKFH